MALQVAAALPAAHREALEELEAVLPRLPICDLVALREAIEHKGTRTLRESLMAVRGERVRVAEWHVVEEQLEDGGMARRCEHKRYAIGSQLVARHGEIGDETWVEAWIA